MTPEAVLGWAFAALMWMFVLYLFVGLLKLMRRKS